MGAFQSAAESLAAIRVLVVDDDDLCRALMTRQLHAMGCTVAPVGTASAFLAELITSRRHYDLAVIDVNLPDLSGDKILSWLSESEETTTQSLPVLLMTGAPQRMEQLHQLSQRNVSLLAKPYRYSDLERAVSELLRGGTGH